MLRLRRHAGNRPVLLGTVGFAVVLALTACGQAGAEPAIPQGAGFSSWVQNGSGGRYVVPVVTGRAAALSAPQLGTVQTDSNCTPDVQGLSHCHNIIALANGSQIEIVDNHQMSIHRCLRPGETVRVSPMHDRWVTVQVRRP